jgi:hypothetical protein
MGNIESPETLATVLAISFVAIVIFAMVMSAKEHNRMLRRRRRRPEDILAKPFEERAKEAAKIIQACMPLEDFEPDDDVISIFAAQRQPDGRVIPGTYLWGKNDQILVLPPEVIKLVYLLLAPDTHPLDYGPFEATYPCNRKIEDNIELSCNPHDLSRNDLARISRKYPFTPPNRSQLAAYQAA